VIPGLVPFPAAALDDIQNFQFVGVVTTNGGTISLPAGGGPDRIVMVCTGFNRNGTTGPTDVTIGGVAATQLALYADSSVGYSNSIYFLRTNVSGSVAINASGAITNFGGHAVYVFDKPSNPVAGALSTSSVTGSSRSYSVATVPGTGVVIFMSNSFNSTTSTWNTAIEDVDRLYSTNQFAVARLLNPTSNPQNQTQTLSASASAFVSLGVHVR
jgi:hypothetical protein